VWSREHHWIPRFERAGDGVQLAGTIFAPPGEKGFVYLLEVASTGPSDVIRLGLEGWWRGVEMTVFTSRTLETQLVVQHDSWTGSLVGEARTGLPLLAWGVQASQDGSLELEGNQFRWTCEVDPTSSPSVRIAFFVAINLEGDGARTGALHLRRRGWEAMLTETARWLEERALPAPNPDVARVLNENLFFNYFFAQGDCLDTDEPVLVTSRSPDYYVCAAYWARDAFLWSFPALLLVDRARARLVLLAGLTRYLRWAGHHALYINGTVLYPGFELDEACAPIIGLGTGLEATGDPSLLDEPAVQAALPVLRDALVERFDQGSGLYSTFLTPHDDPTLLPFLTYNNALVARSLEILANGFVRQGNGDQAHDLRRRAADLRKAIAAACVVEGPFGQQYACAVDGHGRHELEEQPGGSLSLLPQFGLSATGDPVYLATLRWITSKHNPHAYPGKFGGVGSPHFRFPSIFDVSNRLLRNDPSALELVKAAPLDHGLACESFDPETGVVRTGAAMASAGGLLAASLHACLTQSAPIAQQSETRPAVGQSSTRGKSCCPLPAK
jgi:hypothetical protein